MIAAKSGTPKSLEMPGLFVNNSLRPSVRTPTCGIMDMKSAQLLQYEIEFLIVTNDTEMCNLTYIKKLKYSSNKVKLSIRNDFRG